MNTKQYPDMLKKFSFTKLLNIAVILSMFLTSCGTPEKHTADEAATKAPEKELVQNNYEPPVYTHPEPVMGKRPEVSQDANEQVFQKLPIQFVENAGQFDKRALYQAQVEQQTAFITHDAIWLTVLEEKDTVATEDSINYKMQELLPEGFLRRQQGQAQKGVNLKLTFVGANNEKVISGFTPLDTTISYFARNSDSAISQADVPVWGGIRYENIYKGFDLELTGNNSNFSWQFSKNSQSDNSQSATNEIRIKIDGAQSLNIQGSDIVISTELTNVIVPLPEFKNFNFNKVYVQNNEVVFSLLSPASFEIDNNRGSSHFAMVSFQNNRGAAPLTEIPNFSSGYITVLSASNQDTVNDIAVDPNGNAYIVGNTESPDFPITPGAFDADPYNTTNALNGALFVSKFNVDGGIEYSTFVGNGFGSSIAVDSNGNAYITGDTLGGIPITPGAFDTTYNGEVMGINGFDAFYMKLNSEGSEILYSTFLGGGRGDWGDGITLGADGNIYIAGGTESYEYYNREGYLLHSKFPSTTGAYDTDISFSSGEEAFVAKFSAGGQLVYSTFLGSPESAENSHANEFASDIVVDEDGNAYIVGSTASPYFPITSGAYDTSYNSDLTSADIFIAKLNSTGSQLMFSTFLGSTKCSYYCHYYNSITLDNLNNVYVTGTTSSVDFPITADAIDTSLGGYSDLFISKLNSDGGQLLYSTFLGGSSGEIAGGVAVDTNANIYITGTTSSEDFPTTSGTFDRRKNYGGDAFVTKLTSDGSSLAYSTFLGMSSEYVTSEHSMEIAVDANGSAYITGYGVGGSNDVFVAKFDIYGNTVHEASVLSSCNVSGECPQSAAGNSQGIKFGPINTRTGGLFYQTEDISIPSVAKDLNFFRTYSSLATDLYSSTLGFGWTHNLETRLIFPTDPGGEEGYVLFKAHTANQYQFVDNGNGTYAPTPGIVGSLVLVNNQYVLTYPDQTVYTFNSTGRLQTWEDAQEHVWQYTYNAIGLVEQVSADNDTRYLILGYDNQGRIVSVTDHTERSVIYTYDGNDDLVSTTSLTGGTWQYEYNSAHRLTRVIDPMGNTDERTEYDAQGRAVKQWDGEGNLLGSIIYNADGTTTITDPFENIETYSYDMRSTLTESADGIGGITEKTYDKNFRPLTITDADDDTITLAWSKDGTNLLGVKDALGNQTSITYDALNNPQTVLDPLNHETTYEYDGTLLKKVIDATQGETSYTYTTEGYLESVTDGEGITTSYGYDSLGQRTSMTDELQNTWEYTYDNLGRLVNQIDPLERVTHNEYDVAGRLTSVTRNYDPNRAKNADNEWNIVTEYEYDAAGNQTLVRDTLGRETQYIYDDAGRLIKTIDPELHETVSEYDEAGRLSVTIDALQHHTYYFYDKAGRLKETKNELNGTTSTSYNLDKTVASTTDALNRTTYYAYDGLKRVTAVTQPGGGQTKNTYDKLGNLVRVEDALGKVTQYEYDAAGRLIKTIDPDLKETESFYDDAGRLIQTVDARKNHTTYEYDETGRQKKVIDQLGGTTTYEYDAVGRRSAVIDGNQKRTEYTYDHLDRVVAVTNASGTVYTEYDATGQVISRTDANGNAVEFTYTTLGQLKTQKDAAGGTTTYGYDALGNRISVQDTNLHTTNVEYDELNRLVKTIDPTLRETRTVYDAAGQVITTFDPNNQTTNYEYNEMGLQTKVRDPLEHEIKYTYNAAGQMTSMLDANGIATAYEYDALGRLKAVIENYQAAVLPTAEINVHTEYTYDENGNRLTVKDGNGHVTNFTYDELNRLTSESDPLGNSWSYAYDALGNRISMTDANGKITNYTYDDTNRLQGVDSAGTEADVSFSYDAGGRRTGMTDALGTTTWNYDDLNRPISITDPFEKTVGYAYDAVGNRTGLTYSGKEVRYVYDSANRLTNVNDQNRDTNYEYDVLGRVANIYRSNGVNTTYDYDVAGRLIQLNHATGEGELASYQYTYDAAGNRTQAVERLPSLVGPTVRLTVVDSSGGLMVGKEVYAFNGDTYTGYHQITGANGQVAITLPAGDFRFRVDVDGTQFWSGTENHCTVGHCSNLLVTIPTPVTIVVNDSDGNLRANILVYAFIGDQYTGHHGVTNAEGALMLRLPEGDYHFRADVNSTQFWSEDACSVPNCEIIPITVTLPVTVTVLDNVGMPHAGIEVYAFNGTTYTGKHALTDENGQVQITLPKGDYRFRADFNGTQFWSGEANHCTVPNCRETGITVMLPLVVTVAGIDGSPQQGIHVYAFNNTTYTGFNGTTDADGRVNFTLPAGSYRFRADLNGTQFWSDAQNHCTVPDCTGAQITLTSSMTISVTDTENAPKDGVPVYAFNGTTYTGYHGTTNASGQASLTLPQGSYRFRADYNGTQFWSGASNHCDVPGCLSANVTVTNSMKVTVQDIVGTQKAGLKIYAFNDATYRGYNATTDANGEATFTLPQGSYRFRADYNGTQFWSGASNHCDVPGCSSASIVVTNSISMTVQDTEGAPKAGVSIYAFNGTTYTGYNVTTNGNGEATFTLPQGSYRFRADYHGTQFWSGAQNHCDVPGCTSASVTVTNGVKVTVTDTENAPKAGVTIYAFNGTTYSGYSATTDADGQVNLTLPQGSYRFRADYNGTQFWSGASNHCDVPGCSSASVTVTNGLLVMVQDTEGTPKAGLKVYAFNGTTYAGYNGSTNANGQAVFTLPLGSYRFRADLNSTQFWSGAGNHCDVPGCGSTSITVTDPVTVTVHDTDGTTKPGIKVYAFNGTTYTSYNATTNTNGQVVFTLPLGSYRFRADLNGTQFWSGASNHCALPGCTGGDVTVTIPLTLTVQTAVGTPQSAIKVYAFNGATYTGYTATTNPSGQTIFTLPLGNYRFRADYNGTQYWSGTVNHCTVPGCLSLNMIVGPQPTVTATTLPTVTPTQTETPLPPTSTPVPTETASPTLEPIATETPIATEMPLVRLFDTGNVYNISYVKPQSLFDAEMGTGIGLVGEYFNNSMDINGEPLYTRLDPQVNFNWYGASPAEGVSDDFTARWTGQIEAPVSDEYIFGTMADDRVRIWIDGQIYIDDWDNPQDFWREGPAINLVGGQKYDIQIDFRDAGGWAQVSLEWLNLSESNGWWKKVPMRYLYPPATNNMTVTVSNTDGVPQKGSSIHVFDGTADTGIHADTNINGQVTFALPNGSYRFRADLNGTEFWSGETNHCDVPGCSQSEISISTQYDSVTVNNFDSETLDSAWTWVEPLAGTSWSLTNNPGSFQFTLPSDSDYNLWDDTAPSLRRSDMGTGDFVIETSLNFVTDEPSDEGYYQSGLVIGFSDTDQLWVDVSGDGRLNLNRTGEYIPSWKLSALPVFLRAEKVGTNYTFDYKEHVGDHWTYFATYTTSTAVAYVGILGGADGTSNDVTSNVDYFRLARTASVDVIVTVLNTDGAPQEGFDISVFDGAIDTGITGVTDGNGQVIVTLPNGSYRFRAESNGAQFWSDETNHCDVPGCNRVGITIPQLTPVSVSVHDSNGSLAGVPVYVFNGTTDTGYHQVTNENGEAIFSLPEGENYRFRADYTAPGTGNSVQFWNSSPEVCDIPGCDHAEIEVKTNPVIVTVTDTEYNGKEGLDVYAFDETTYTGYQLTTDTNGQVTFSLPDGSYRFRTDLNGTQFWSGKINHCDVPGCDQVEITVTNPIPVAVHADYGGPLSGVTVTAFNGNQETGYHQVTNEDGIAFFTLPLVGEYHFRANYTAPGAGNSIQFWNSSPEVCTLPTCNYATIIVTRNPVIVTVLDTDSAPKQGLNIFAFNGDQNTGIYLTTDANGQVTFTLPFGTSYRFRTDFNGVTFWSGAENHCDPDYECEAPVITVVKPVIVEVKGEQGTPYPNLSVYAFLIDPSTGSGQAYTGRHATTDAKGQVMFQLPQGNYHFRADYDGVQFWNNPSASSGSGENDCAVPGCGSATITLPGGFINNEVTIDYTYDPLYRLTKAYYFSGDAYAYTYDAVGNRLTQESMVNGLSSTVNYNYDIANRLADVDGVPYAYDENGNLLNDGVNTYTYDPANRLTTVNSTTSYTYNGLGDRLSQTVDGIPTNYTLDLNTGLTQVLSDGTNTYTYGLGRISQQSGSTPEYFLGDALGSVRQLTSQNGQVTYAASYDPYGMVTYTGGASKTDYGYTGESYGDSTQLVYLRARYYNINDGRFLTKDPSRAESNLYLYTRGNPVNFVDPSGYITENEAIDADNMVNELDANYDVSIQKDWEYITGYKIVWRFPPKVETCSNWDPGKWDLMELKTIKEAIIDLKNAFGDQAKFKTFIGDITVVKSSGACGRGCFDAGWGNRQLQILDGGNPPTAVDVINNSSIDKWTVVHELGHAWDQNFGWDHSDSLEDYTKGHTTWWGRYPAGCDVNSRLPGCNDASYFYGGVPAAGSDVNFNKVEDFAESVTAYVYPSSAQAKVAGYQNDPIYGSLFYADYTQTERSDFINNLVTGNP